SASLTVIPVLYSPRIRRMRHCRPAVFALALLAALGRPSSAQPAPALEAIFEQGVQALKAGRLDEAEAAFRRVLHQGGNRAYVHNNLGIVYQQQGKEQEALTEFREALRLDPGYAAPRVGLGASLLALGRVTEATAALE